MKKGNVKLGATYAVKVSGSVVPVRLDKANPHGGWDGTNMKTRKQVRIKSAQRLRGLWPKKTMPIVAEPDESGVAQAVAAVEQSNLAEGVTVPEAKKERPSLLNLAAHVLAEAGTPMGCKEIVERVIADGAWNTEGKTPAATLYSAILREIQTKGEQARFRKVERGKFVATK